MRKKLIVQGRRYQGNLPDKYKLSKIVSYIDNEINLCIPKEIISNIYFRFQGKKIKLQDITDSLADEDGNEILPGIYLRDDGREKWFSKLKNKVKKKKQYFLKNENKKDTFQICSDLEKGVSDYQEGTIKGNSMELVNPQDIEQPWRLGGGKCGGCPVYSYFNHLGILEESCYKDGYYFFHENNAIEATKNEEYFLGRCRDSYCYITYKKILNEGYNSEKLEDRDQINVVYKNGKYFAEEGKHRVCAMRRFGYTDIIPMKVTRYIEDPKGHVLQDVQYFSDNKRILKNCYETYERIGISADDVRELLKNPNATVLDYLKKSKYSYDEILKHSLW